jgi:hypothetical protein
VQLTKHAREVTLDRTCGNEEGLGDLAVREALAGELGDAALTGGQRVEPGENDPPRARARSSELGLRLVGERPGTRAMGGVECVTEQFSSFGAAIAPPKHGAEIGKGAGSFQFGIAALEHFDRLTEQQLSTVAAGHDAGGALGDAESARSSERQRELDFLLCETSRLFAFAER